MTKGELIELIWLAVIGGKPSPDVTVKRIDIRAMLPALIGDALLVYNREARRDQLQEIRAYGATSEGRLPSELLRTITFTPVKDDARGLHYYDLPKAVYNLPTQSGIQSVFPSNGGVYVRVGGPEVIAGIPDTDSVFFWYERQDSGNERLYIKGLGLPLCTHYARVLFRPDTVGDNDEIPIPQGFEKYVIDAGVKHFGLQRQMPADYEINDHDDSQPSN